VIWRRLTLKLAGVPLKLTMVAPVRSVPRILTAAPGASSACSVRVGTGQLFQFFSHHPIPIAMPSSNAIMMAEFRVGTFFSIMYS